jgi:hypothetical protein
MKMPISSVRKEIGKTCQQITYPKNGAAESNADVIFSQLRP